MITYIYQSGVKYTFTPEFWGPEFDPPIVQLEPGWIELWVGIKSAIAENRKLIEYSQNPVNKPIGNAYVFCSAFLLTTLTCSVSTVTK